MFCKNCGRQLQDQKVCPSCGTRRQGVQNTNQVNNQQQVTPMQQEQAIKQPMSKKTKMMIGLGAVGVLAIFGINKIREPYKIVKEVLSEQTIYHAQQSYEIEKGNISKIEDIKKQSIEQGSSKIDIYEAYVEIELDTFKVTGDIVVDVEDSKIRDANNVEYIPLQGIDVEEAWDQISNRDIYVDGLGWLGLVWLTQEYEEYEVINKEVTADLEDKSSVLSAQVRYEDDTRVCDIWFDTGYKYTQNGWTYVEDISSGYEYSFKEEVSISEDDILYDIRTTQIYLTDIGYTVLSDEEAYTAQVVEIKGFPEDNSYVATVDIELEKDLIKVAATVEAIYRYSNEEWSLWSTEEIESNWEYAEGKELTLDIDRFKKRYNEDYLTGSMYTYGDLILDIELYDIEIQEIEHTGLGTGEVQLKLLQETPLYTVVGDMTVYHVYSSIDEAWEVSGISTTLSYEYDLIGTYQGWYKHYAGEEYPGFNLTLDVTTDHGNGKFEGTMTCEVPADEFIGTTELMTYQYKVDVYAVKEDYNDSGVYWYTDYFGDWLIAPTQEIERAKFDINGMVDTNNVRLISHPGVDHPFELTKQ